VRWVLAPAGRKLLSEGAARIYGHDGDRVWDGRWLVVLASVPETQRKRRHQLQTKLAWAGLGNPTAGLWVSPHPERAAEVRRIIDDLELGEAAYSFVGPYGMVGSEAELVRRAWDLDEVSQAYAAFLSEFARLEPVGGEATLLAQIRIVHAWRRFPFLDPQLPDVLLPARWIGHRARSVFEAKHESWERPARRRWAEIASG
jgi:phenylacetic acid degradation operon negative regulatory protein